MPVLKTVEKVWGRELWHHNSDKYCMKTLELRRGAQCSLHFHPQKEETFLVVNGVVRFELYDQIRTLYEGESIDIPSGYPHRFSAITSRARVIEASTHHSDEDVVRLEESREI